MCTCNILLWTIVSDEQLENKEISILICWFTTKCIHCLVCLFAVSDHFTRNVEKNLLKENPNCSTLFCDIKVIFGADKR